MKKKEFLAPYRYIKWNEEKILSTIINELDWESPSDTIQTWRTDDSTVPWYNFLYYSAVGFTENDVLLSNMIRDGQITREAALLRAEQENKPRYGEIKKYLKEIGVEVDLKKLEKRLKFLSKHNKL